VDLAVTLSVVALLVSLGSAVFAKRGADETRLLRQIEADRRHDERVPALSAHVEDVGPGQWHRLWLVLESAEPVDSVVAEIIDGPDVCFADGQTGVEPGIGRTLLASWGSLTIGTKDAAWRVVIGPTAPKQIRLHATCRIGNDAWPVLLTVPLPSPSAVDNVW